MKKIKNLRILNIIFFISSIIGIWQFWSIPTIGLCFSSIGLFLLSISIIIGQYSMFLSAFIHYNLDWGVRISKVCLLGASILLIPMSIISEMPFNLFVKVIYEIFIAFAFPVGLAVLFFTYIGFPIRKIILSEKGLYQKQEQAEIEADEWETDFKDGLPAGLSW